MSATAPIVAIGHSTSSSNLILSDVSDPLNPVALSTTTVGAGAIFDVMWLEDSRHLAVNTGGGSFHIIDCANPALPAEVGQFQDWTTYGDPRYMALHQGYVVTTTQYNSGDYALHVIDCSTVTAPAIIGTVDFSTTAASSDPTMGIAIIGDTAVIGSGNGEAMWTVDLSTPTAPAFGTYVSSVPALTGESHQNCDQILAIPGSTTMVVGAYRAGGGTSGVQGGLYLVDISTDPFTVVDSVRGVDDSRAENVQGLAWINDTTMVTVSPGSTFLGTNGRISVHVVTTTTITPGASQVLPVGVTPYVPDSNGAHIYVPYFGFDEFAAHDIGFDYSNEGYHATADMPYVCAYNGWTAPTVILGPTVGFIGPGKFMG